VVETVETKRNNCEGKRLLHSLPLSLSPSLSLVVDILSPHRLVVVTLGDVVVGIVVVVNHYYHKSNDDDH
jgi:hypothetical protein